MVRRILFLASCAALLYGAVVFARAEPQKVGAQAAIVRSWEDQVFTMNENRRLVGREMTRRIQRAEAVAHDASRRARQLASWVEGLRS